VHPGESWEETFAALSRYLPTIKSAVSPHHPFPVGLRLSARAAWELTEEGAAEFSAWLEGADCFVPTINVFPFGEFHGRAVKEEVYLPDWRVHKRSEYTILCAFLLAGWLPEGASGSLSTVPIRFGSRLDKDELAAVRRNLVDALLVLDRIWEQKGRNLVLALEPEPGCLLESTSGVVRFLESLELPERLRRRVGICLDCSHLAVQFEEPAQVLQTLSRAGVRIAKVQVSSALRVRHEAREVLASFVEPVYLHQVVVRGATGVLARYPDLPEALREHAGEEGDEWRCHFHLPLYLEDGEKLGTTRSFAQRLLPLLDHDTLLEVETYSWHVLPAGVGGKDLAADLIREIRWVQEAADAPHRRP